jgi:hypothetical protein
MLEPDEGKLSSPVLRGPAPSNGGWPLGKNEKVLTCWTRSGVLETFAFSGMSNADSAPGATLKSLGQRDGAFTTVSPVSWVVRQVPRTAFYFTRSAMTGFTANVFPYRNRVSFKEAFAGPELCDWKLSRTVLRGLDGRKVVWLLGEDSTCPQSHCIPGT